MAAEVNMLTDLLGLLGVPYTSDYSSQRFDTMPFRTLFGLSSLLKEYGVATHAYTLSDKNDVGLLPVPFVAPMDVGMVIVTGIDGQTVTYLSQGVPESMPLQEWKDDWSGTAMCVFPAADACEPDYRKHRRIEFLAVARDYGMIAGGILLFLYLFVTNGIYRHLSTVLLTLFDMAGLYFTYLLVQKTLNIKNKHADAVCRVLQDGGCDNIVKSDASKLFGFFSWSEVGFTYFSVSLLALLMFPASLPYLALFNACCLPYTCWSIWYQKCKAHTWCTLCVSVQCTLWCLFFCYLGGGWFSGIFPLRIEAFVLGLTYLTVLLVMTKISPRFENKDEN